MLRLLSGDTEKALEPISGKNGLFTQGLLEALKRTKEVPYNYRDGRQYVHHLFSFVFDEVKQLSNDELLRFRPDDPMSGHPGDAGFSITGGHHRMNEIIRRVQAGELPADTPVRILFHD